MVHVTRTKQPDINNRLIDELAPFNVKAVNYMRRTLTSWLNVAEGGKRAGKNVMNIAMWCAALEHHPEELHIIAGVTASTAKVSIMDSDGFGVLSYFEGRIVKGVHNKLEAYFVDTAVGQKIILTVGGVNADSYKRLRGMSIGSSYLTEANLLHEKFVQEIQNRMDASERPLLFMDLNPEPPGHWFYQNFLSVHEEEQAKDPNYGYNYEHFTIADNMSISDEALKTVLGRYDKKSIFYKMDILGQRVASANRIYNGFESSDMVVSSEFITEHPPIHFAIGIDVGGTDATVATLIGFTASYKYCYLLEGYYHKQGKDMDVYDESMYVKEICDAIEGWIPRYRGLMHVPVYCESAAKLFKSGLRNEFRRRQINLPIHNSFKKDGINERIKLNSSLIGQKRFFIRDLPIFAPWIEAYENAQWSAKALAGGEFVRLDTRQFPIDCLDSTEYAMYPFKDQLV